MTDLPVMLMGQDPGPHWSGGGRRLALYPKPVGCAGWNLWRLTGLTEREYIRTARRNLFDDYPGRWNAGRAAYRAREIEPELDGYRVVVMGWKVAEAFCIERPRCDYLEWFRTPVRDIAMAVHPHPSGLNRVLNTGDMRSRCEAFLREALGAGSDADMSDVRVD